MRLLSIETATSVCSVAVHRDGHCEGHTDLEDGMAHSRELGSITEKLLHQLHLNTRDLDAVIVSKGPGSYTGLRIGVSFANAICYAQEIPLIGINTLEILASAAISERPGDHYYCPMIDARRMEVYRAIYDQDLKEIETTSPLIVEGNSFDYLKGDKKIVLFGNGMEKCKDVLGEDDSFIYLDNVKLSARFSGTIGKRKYDRGEFEDLAYFEPFYLKSFQAKPSKKLL